MKEINSKIKVFRIAAWPLILFFLAYFSPMAGALGANSGVEEKDLSAPSSNTDSASTVENTAPEQKRGGIFKVGRAFKKVGKGIKKGMVATGRAFKKAGTAIKTTFTGKDSQPETQPRINSDSGLDHVGDETGPPKSGNGASS